MPISTVIYARSSPDCPLSAEEQVDSLRAVAAANGWMIARVFIDRPTMSNRGRDRRPGQAALIGAIRSGGVQKVLMWGVDRLGRSLVDLVACMNVCRAQGVELYLHEQNLDTTASNGMSLFDFAGMMTFHLLQSRRDRILRGQAAARAASVRFGRPPIPAAKVEKARHGLAAGKGVRQVARSAGISAASVSRLKNAMGMAAANLCDYRPSAAVAHLVIGAASDPAATARQQPYSAQ
jgi:DNA invertase Pin-like site-specific DNA recombinase